MLDGFYALHHLAYAASRIPIESHVLRQTATYTSIGHVSLDQSIISCDYHPRKNCPVVCVVHKSTYLFSNRSICVTLSENLQPFSQHRQRDSPTNMCGTALFSMTNPHNASNGQATITNTHTTNLIHCLPSQKIPTPRDRPSCVSRANSPFCSPPMSFARTIDAAYIFTPSHFNLSLPLAQIQLDKSHHPATNKRIITIYNYNATIITISINIHLIAICYRPWRLFL